MYVDYYPIESNFGPTSGDPLLLGQGERVSLKIPVKDYIDESNDGAFNLTVEIKYLDYTNMTEKATFVTFKVLFSNNNMTGMTPVEMYVVEYPDKIGHVSGNF
ncbi:hypothetical protein [Methanohalophilus sp.]|uniref:hypothetical protein n=1 Tax=Methanohalophilus sp. TaxID=1966352 RepID=UPI00261E9B57|nr:hypothetical protein [Methanohalophilus sp.]MDK2892058.1 hypothetical protein [Methanohalophilus sp.]